MFNARVSQGKQFANNIQKSLTSIGLRLEDCRGQTYDGAGNRSGKIKGCATRFQEVSPRAPYFHCASHSLNLALSKASSVTEVNCKLAVIKSTGLFFNGSPKRTRHLEKATEALNTQRQEDNTDNLPQIRLHKLKLLCETRWVERHTTLDDFIVLYEPLLDCLGSINATSGSWSSKCVTEASGLLVSLSPSSFIIACTCASYLFGFTQYLSTMLQGTSMDVVTSREQIGLIINEIRTIRTNADEEFDRIFSQSAKMATVAGI